MKPEGEFVEVVLQVLALDAVVVAPDEPIR
jgi:hypothetical protein